MSKNFKGYLGDQIGKLGTAVGRKWKNKMVYSAYQGKVRNPKTENQCIIRARFSRLSMLAASFLDATEIGLKASAKHYDYTESDHFMKRNWDAVTATDPEVLTVDYGALVVSEGRTPWVEFHEPDFSDEASVSVTFDPGNKVPKASANDQVYLFVYQPDTDMGVLSLPVSRSTGSVSVAVPSLWSGMTVHLYGFAVGAGDSTKGKTSPSTYVGTGTIA